MHLNIFAILAAIATVGVARPFTNPTVDSVAETSVVATEDYTHPLAARGNTAGVYLCDKTGFKGNCQWILSSGGKCHQYPYSAYSSFGPDHGIRCTLFQSNDCNPHSGQRSGLQFPGTGSLGLTYNLQTGVTWSPKSFQCGWVAGNVPGWEGV